MKATFYLDDEYFGPWFRCPYCGETRIIGDSNFCNMCGKPIECDMPAWWELRKK